MRAEVRGIEANEWPDWPARPSGALGEEFAWFTVSVGAVGSPGADLFRVAVATPAGVSRRRNKRPFVGLVVQRLDPAAIDRLIRDFVAYAEGPTWEIIAEQLGRATR
jgi:Immunity protein 8